MDLLDRSRQLVPILILTLAALLTVACGAQERLDDARQRVGEALVQDSTATPDETAGATAITASEATAVPSHTPAPVSATTATEIPPAAVAGGTRVDSRGSSATSSYRYSCPSAGSHASSHGQAYFGARTHRHTHAYSHA